MAESGAAAARAVRGGQGTHLSPQPRHPLPPRTAGDSTELCRAALCRTGPPPPLPGAAERVERLPLRDGGGGCGRGPPRRVGGGGTERGGRRSGQRRRPTRPPGGIPGGVRWESPHGALSRAVRPRFPPRRSASGVRASALPARDSLAPPAGTAQQQHRVTRRAQSASLRPGRCPRAPPVTALPLASAPAVREPLSNGSGRAGRERRSAIASALGRGPRASPHRNAARAPRPPQPPPGGGSCARGSLLLFAFPPLQHNAAAR
eukprot:XP_025007681.1 hapless 2-like [Gallus gallus]